MKIYPTDVAQGDLWNAAWDAYIRFVSPYDNVVDLLYDEYALAIERTSAEPLDRAIPPQRTGEQLIQHLIIFYGRGKLRLDDPEGLLAKFYQHAPDKLRAQALRVVGRSLQQMDTVPPEVLRTLSATLRESHRRRAQLRLA